MMSKKERARLVVMAKGMKSEMKISEASEPHNDSDAGHGGVWVTVKIAFFKAFGWMGLT